MPLVAECFGHKGGEIMELIVIVLLLGLLFLTIFNIAYPSFMRMLVRRTLLGGKK